MLTGKLERVSLSKSMAESKLSDFDRYKAMIELEMTELIARHKTAITERMARAAQVCSVCCVCVGGGVGLKNGEGCISTHGWMCMSVDVYGVGEGGWRTNRIVLICQWVTL